MHEQTNEDEASASTSKQLSDWAATGRFETYSQH